MTFDQTTLPEILWHGTSEARLAAAMRSGYLFRATNHGRLDRIKAGPVHLTDRRDIALHFARQAAHRTPGANRPVLLGVHTHNLDRRLLAADPMMVVAPYGAKPLLDLYGETVVEDLAKALEEHQALGWQNSLRRAHALTYIGAIPIELELLDISAMDSPLPCLHTLTAEEAAGGFVDAAHAVPTHPTHPASWFIDNAGCVAIGRRKASKATPPRCPDVARVFPWLQSVSGRNFQTQINARVDAVAKGHKVRFKVNCRDQCTILIKEMDRLPDLIQGHIAGVLEPVYRLAPIKFPGWRGHATPVIELSFEAPTGGGLLFGLRVDLETAS